MLIEQSPQKGIAQKFDGIVSKPVQKLVGRLTLFQGISQVLSHRKTT
jgi:hypothetical protein